jgi:hypothetical protein
MKRTRTIGSFMTKIIATTDNKKLKEKSQSYTYGTISIRDKKLSSHIGEEVSVKVSKLEKKVDK